MLVATQTLNDLYKEGINVVHKFFRQKPTVGLYFCSLLSRRFINNKPRKLLIVLSCECEEARPKPLTLPL